MMAVVTDKEIYVDDNLRKVLDLCVERQEKKYDNLLIIDGKERVGKSTIAKSIACYVAHKSKIPFTVDNIFFDPEDMIKFATSKRLEKVWSKIWAGSSKSNHAGDGHTLQNLERQRIFMYPKSLFSPLRAPCIICKLGIHK